MVTATVLLHSWHLCVLPLSCEVIFTCNCCSEYRYYIHYHYCWCSVLL